MEKLLDILKESLSINNINKKYPVIRGNINGLKIRNKIPNMSSISSTFNDYEILKGIRKIPIFEFDAKPTELFYAANDIERVKELSVEIKNNKEISPLIVVFDDKDLPYILEGAHRLGALYILDVKYIPALIVIDRD